MGCVFSPAPPFSFLSSRKRIIFNSSPGSRPPCCLPEKELENKQVLELDVSSPSSLSPLPCPHPGESCENGRARPDREVRHSPDAVLRGFVGQYSAIVGRPTRGYLYFHFSITADTTLFCIRFGCTVGRLDSHILYKMFPLVSLVPTWHHM